MTGLVATPDALDLPEGPLPAGIVEQIIARAHGYERWSEQVASTGYCSRPIRLRGQVHRVDSATGEMLPVYTTDDEPDGVLLTACGNRRRVLCPSCSATYSRDIFHVVAAGLRGGKGIPATVASHPMLFVTLTAPSFGAVHAHRNRGTAILPCRPRRRGGRCPHGVRLSCAVRHSPEDPRVGTPLCSRCFDYEALVVWNGLCPELWRRTVIYMRRGLARAAGIRERELPDVVALRFFKVAETQRRGAVHLHAVLRLDAAPPDDDPEACSPPPEAFTAELLEQAVRWAASRVSVPAPRGRVASWGPQIDVHRVAGDTELSAEAVASYIAKYATKGAEQVVGTPRRISDEEELDRLEASPHVVAIVRAAWELGGRQGYEGLRLREWAHQLGFGGHFATKSRRYSTTLGAIRRARADYARRKAEGGGVPLGGVDEDQAEEEELRVGRWWYAGAGYRTSGEVFLALQAAAQAREYRELAREAALLERWAM